MQFKNKVVNLKRGGGPAEVSLGEGSKGSAENELQELDYDQSVEGQKAKGKGREAK